MRSITRPVRPVKAALEALATGDLTVATGVTSTDEVGQMAASLDAAQASLREVLAAVVASADAVAASSEELSASSAQISASAEETSAQSGVVVRRRRGGLPQRADRRRGRRGDGRLHPGDRSNAAEASEVAARAVVAAETTTATVAKLGESSAEIGNVVKVITLDRRADQPAGAERHDRGGPGRRGRQGLRRRRQRGQGAGAGDGEGDRGHRPPGAGHPGRHHRRGGRDRGDLERSSRRSPTGRPPSPARWRSRPRRPTRCPGRCRRPPSGTGEIATNITGVSTAADSTTQALTQTRTAVDELSRMAADLRTTVGQFTY